VQDVYESVRTVDVSLSGLYSPNELASSSYPGLPHVFHADYPDLPSSEQYQLDTRTGLRWLLDQGKVAA